MPLEQTGPDGQGFFHLHYFPGKSPPNPSDASEPYLGVDEQVLAAVVNPIAAAAGTITAVIAAQTFHVNALTGNDSNPGTASQPVRTYLFGIRKNKFGPSPFLIGDVTIQYHSAPAADDQLVVTRVMSDTGDRLLQIICLPTVLATLQLTGSTNVNRAANTPYEIQAAGLGAFRGRVYVITSAGPRKGVSGVVGKNLGADNCRTPGPILTGTGLPTFSAPVQPQIGDTITIQRGAVFTKPLLVEGCMIDLVVNDAELPPAGALTSSAVFMSNLGSGFQPVLNRCQLTGGVNTQPAVDFPIFQSCSFSGFTFGGQFLGCYHNQISMLAPVFADFDCLIEETPNGFALQGNIAGIVSYVGTMGIFDIPAGPAVACFDGSSIICNNGVSIGGAASLYGSGNAGSAIFRIERGPGTSIGYPPPTAPPITGPADIAGNYLLLSTVAKTRANVDAGPGIVDAVHQTMMVPSV